MGKLTTSSRTWGPRPRWVGQPVEPQNAHGKSPSGRQKYYGAVELPGVGGPIYVNDVVKILSKDSLGGSGEERFRLTQVRTLEKALHDEFDPKRRLYGWARPGITMDREDFIDLAKVSKCVPGKTPAQVLAFYYKYLAAAEPLIDVVYGPKAAEARRQEKIHQDCEVNKQYYLGGGPASSSSRTADIRLGSTQISDGLPRASLGSPRDGVGSTSGKGLPKRRLGSPKSHILRLPSPKPPKKHILQASKANVDQPPAADVSVGHVDCEAAEAPLREATIGKYGSGAGTNSSGLTSPSLPLSRLPLSRRIRSSYAVDGITSAGSGPGPLERTSDDDEGGHCAPNKPTSRARDVINDVVDRNADGGRVRHAVIPNRRAGRNSIDSSSDRPPAAENFEVQDNDGGTRTQGFAGDRHRRPPPISGAKALSPKLVVKADSAHPNTLGPERLKQMARQMCSTSAVPVPAPIVQPPPTYSVWPRSVAAKDSSMERQRMGRVTYTPYAVPISSVGLTEVQRYAVWDSRSTPCYNHDPNIQRHEDQYIYGVGGSSTPGSATAPPDNNAQDTLEKAPTEDMFGVMAPCWRLLERAKLYMDKDQLVYMRWLILLHVKQPMSRDQLLERAESCLQEQGHIFAAFVRVFDRINQPPSVPVYPTKGKQPGPSLNSGRSQVMPYTSPYALPATVPEHPGSAHYSSAPRSFRGETGECKTAPPSDVANRSPRGRALSYPDPAEGMPRGGWYPSRLVGGSDGLAQYPSDLDPPRMSITENAWWEAPNVTDSFCDREAVSRKGWMQEWLHRPLHQPSQWQMECRNASLEAMAAAKEAAKRDEPRGDST